MADWWEDAAEVVATEALLARASILPESERAYYRGKPWKWTGERNIALRLEAVFAECGVGDEGWDMTGSDVLRLLQKSSETTSDQRVRLAKQRVPTMARPFEPGEDDDRAELKNGRG